MADWVIVVDDDETNLKMAGHILSRTHMRVTAMRSGEALIDYIREKEVPDLILLDVKMSGMDGFETLSELRKLDKGKTVPVIFLTADEKEGTEVRGLTLGAMDFIKKPFVPKVLTVRVRHMIDLDHLQQNLENEVEKKAKENDRNSLPFFQFAKFGKGFKSVHPGHLYVKKNKIRHILFPDIIY